MVKLPQYISTKIISSGRKVFLHILTNEVSPEKILIHSKYKRRLWGIDFRNNLFNAAGMFKNGYGYNLAASQGAAAYLSGTTTALKRMGNRKNYISHPVMYYPSSHCASNWMGLPNDSHEIVASRLYKIDKVSGCPVGASVSSDPDQSGDLALNSLLSGMILYQKANVDFIELNESCPNVSHDSSNETINGLDKKLIERLDFISDKFLKRRQRNLPVIVKFSNDTNPELVPGLVDSLINFGFDGINFGNTSTDYLSLRKEIMDIDLPNYDYFTTEYGGGLSGHLLQSRSLALSTLSVNIVSKLNPRDEFHVIRTGGIENKDDLICSEKSGILLNQWFTGYFDNFSRFGHYLYKEIFSDND